MKSLTSKTSTSYVTITTGASNLIRVIFFTGEGKCEVNSRLFVSASISSRNKKFCLRGGDVGVYIRACLTRLSRGRDRPH